MICKANISFSQLHYESNLVDLVLCVFLALEIEPNLYAVACKYLTECSSKACVSKRPVCCFIPCCNIDTGLRPFESTYRYNPERTSGWLCTRDTPGQAAHYGVDSCPSGLAQLDSHLLVDLFGPSDRTLPSTGYEPKHTSLVFKRTR